MSEKAHNSDRPGDSEAMTPVHVPPDEANGPERPPAAGMTMAPTPPDEERDVDGEDAQGRKKPPRSREG